MPFSSTSRVIYPERKSDISHNISLLRKVTLILSEEFTSGAGDFCLVEISRSDSTSFVVIDGTNVLRSGKYMI